MVSAILAVAPLGLWGVALWIDGYASLVLLLAAWLVALPGFIFSTAAAIRARGWSGRLPHGFAALVCAGFFGVGAWGLFTIGSLGNWP